MRRAPEATHQTHISDFAMQQLLQAGVSAQLLQQLQTATQTDLQTPTQTDPQSAPQTAPQGSPAVGRPRHHPKPKRPAKAGGDSRSGSSPGVAQRAHSLKDRQEAILRRISTLQGDQAHSSHGDLADSMQKDPGIASGALVWASVKPTMKVGLTREGIC